MRTYRIDMIPGKVGAVINASQYDYGYEVQVTLYEGSVTYQIPSGASIRVEGTKSDAKGFSYECRVANGIIYVPIQIQMTAVQGNVPCELVVYKNGLRVGSCNFILAVEESALDGDTDISETDIPAIIAEATEQMEAAASSASQAAASATQAASSAASAETAKTAAIDAAQDAIDAAQELQTAIQFNAALIHETASGTIAHFEDGADDVPMKSIIAEITPVQDLNGYDKPWPGGGGKNRLENTYTTQTVSGVTLTVNEDGTIVANGTASATITAVLNSSIPLTQGQYILTGCPAGGGSSSNYKIDIVKNGESSRKIDTGSGTTFDVDADGQYTARIVIYSGQVCSNLTFEPMVRLSSIADDTFAPYSNICPITGRTGLTVKAGGRNLLPKNTTLTPTMSNGITFTYNEDGSITANGTSTGSAMSRSVPFRVPYGRYRKSERTYVQYKDSSWRTVAGGGYSSTVMEINEDFELSCRINISNGMVQNNVTYYPYIYLESDTSTEYGPYVGASYPVTWESIAGTVYGGTLDVVSGVLTVDSYFFEPTANELTSAATNPLRIGIRTPNRPKDHAFTEAPDGLYCNRLIPVMRQILRDVDDYGIAYDINVNRLQMRLPDVASVAEAQAWLADNPLQIVYKLATPQTYQLTVAEVRTILGGNNIYTDAGEVSVEYIADTKMYIDNKIAELQALVLEN